MYQVKILSAKDLVPFRDLRLVGLLESPGAFGQTPEEFEKMSDQELISWLGPSEDKFTLGAFTDTGTLIGLMGVRREPRFRIRHKGIIWGVYVLPEYRGQGISKALLTKLLAEISLIPGIEQLQLAVSSSQTAAEKLYRSFGFLEFGNEPRAFKVENQFLNEKHMYLLL